MIFKLRIQVTERTNDAYRIESRESIVAQDIVVHDMNMDGLEDIITYPFGISINDGQGHFPKPPTTQETPFFSGYNVELKKADLNGNDELDLIVSAWNSDNSEGSSRVYLDVTYDENKAGYFSFSKMVVYTNKTYLTGLDKQTARGVAVGDLNGDGYQDAVFINSFTSPTESFFTGSVVTINDGEGNLTVSQYISHASDIALGDLDGDGDLDAFLVNRDNQHVGGNQEALDEIWLNDGQGHFIKSSQFFEMEDSVVVKLNDIDQDGDIDAVVAHGNDHVKGQAHVIWLNDGIGGFSKSEFSFGGALNTKNLELVDVDQDGDTDIVTLGYDQFYSEDSDSAYVSTYLPNNKVWLNALISNNEMDGYNRGVAACVSSPNEYGLYDEQQVDGLMTDSFFEGVQSCKDDPQMYGLYEETDLENKYQQGYQDGKASCMEDPYSCNLFSDKDISSSYNEGVSAGVVSCQDDPAACDLFSLTDMDDSFLDGEVAGIESCQNKPSSCGLFDQHGVNAKVEANRVLILRNIIQYLPHGQIISICKKHPESGICDYAPDKKHKVKKTKHDSKHKKASKH